MGSVSAVAGHGQDSIGTSNRRRYVATVALLMQCREQVPYVACRCCRMLNEQYQVEE
jgi:hypothetical protein